MIGGIIGLRLKEPVYEITPQIRLAATYAHCFSHFMASLAKPTAQQIHSPGPWIALQNGGQSFIVEAELQVDDGARVGNLSQWQCLVLGHALIRLLLGQPLRMPIISTMSFSAILKAETQPNVVAYEVMGQPTNAMCEIDHEFYRELQRALTRTARLIEDETFLRGFNALDSYCVAQTLDVQLMSTWTAIELIAKTPKKPKNGTANYLANIISKLLRTCKSDQDRMKNRLIDLYDKRSNVVHHGHGGLSHDVKEIYEIARQLYLKAILFDEWPPSAPPVA